MEHQRREISTISNYSERLILPGILPITIPVYVWEGLSFLERKNTVPGISHISPQRRGSQVTAVLRKTISQKKIPTKPRSGLIFKGLLHRSYGRIFWVANRKGSINPLKIRPPAIRPIDIVLRRSACPGFYRPPFEDAAYGDDLIILILYRSFLRP